MVDPLGIIVRPGRGLATPRNRVGVPPLSGPPRLGYDASLADRWITPQRRDEAEPETM